MSKTFRYILGDSVYVTSDTVSKFSIVVTTLHLQAIFYSYLRSISIPDFASLSPMVH